jgi:hypothetical protein
MLHPNPISDSCCTLPDIAPDIVVDEDQCDDEVGSLVIEKMSIDDVVLGAPCLPITGPVATMACNLQPTESQHHQIEAGCTWDRDNWSCSYDAVFMSFWFIYRKSSPGWHGKWKQQAPKWNGFFGEAFDSLLGMVQSEQSSQATLSCKFTSYREMFRDNLSHINPTSFPCRGQLPTSVDSVTFSAIPSGRNHTSNRW